MGVLFEHTVTASMLDRLEAERVSHTGESQAELVARLRRTEAPGSLPDLTNRRTIDDAARARTRGTRA
jgi:hypothetical protein